MVARTAPKKKAARKPKTSADKIANFSDEEEMKAYYDMLLIRRFEEKAGQLYGMGQIVVSAIYILVKKLL